MFIEIPIPILVEVHVSKSFFNTTKLSVSSHFYIEIFSNQRSLFLKEEDV